MSSPWRVIAVKNGLGEEGYYVGRTRFLFFTQYWRPIAARSPRWYSSYDRALDQAAYSNEYDARNKVSPR